MLMNKHVLDNTINISHNRISGSVLDIPECFLQYFLLKSSVVWLLAKFFCISPLSLLCGYYSSPAHVNACTGGM